MALDSVTLENTNLGPDQPACPAGVDPGLLDAARKKLAVKRAAQEADKTQRQLDGRAAPVATASTPSVDESAATVQDLPVHPAAAAFPMMSPEDIKALSDDIAANGLSHPIVVWKGQVIDGRNRLKACRLAGVEPAYAVKDDLEEEQILNFVMSANVNRRHLDTPQREAIAARIADLRRGNVDSQRTGPSSCGTSVAEAAKLMDVSVSGVERAKTLNERAPELAAKVLAGEKVGNRKLTTSGALKQVKEAAKKAAPPPQSDDADPPERASTPEPSPSFDILVEVLPRLQSDWSSVLAAANHAHSDDLLGLLRRLVKPMSKLAPIDAAAVLQWVADHHVVTTGGAKP